MARENNKNGFTPLEIKSVPDKKATSLTGFTLVEVLTTSAILLFVLTAVYSIYIMLSQFVRDASYQAVLQSHGRLAIERMANDIRLAADVTCPPAGDYIELRYDPAKMGQAGSSWTSRYRLLGDEILYAPDVTSRYEEVILDNVNLGNKTLFQYDGGRDLVTIDLVAENTTLTTTQDSHLTTVVKVRNAD